MRQTYDGLWQGLMQQGHDEGVVKVAVDEGLVRLFMLGSLNWTSSLMPLPGDIASRP